jgi:stalled ribosome alternative rescue factor ArfA
MIRRVNPVARTLLTNRRRPTVVPPKKGKGSYKRKPRTKDGQQT